MECRNEVGRLYSAEHGRGRHQTIGTHRGWALSRGTREDHEVVLGPSCLCDPYYRVTHYVAKTSRWLKNMSSVLAWPGLAWAELVFWSELEVFTHYLAATWVNKFQRIPLAEAAGKLQNRKHFTKHLAQVTAHPSRLSTCLQKEVKELSKMRGRGWRNPLRSWWSLSDQTLSPPYFSFITDSGSIAL